jgi:hypothetical protein
MGKIVDQSAVGTALAAGDLFTLVDISDTTHSAAGTSKKVTATNLFGNLPVALGIDNDGTIGGNGLNEMAARTFWRT